MEKFDSEAMREAIFSAAKKGFYSAYAPYSKFHVGAGLLAAKDNKVFSGCNIENASYGGTVCAERTAFLKAISEGYNQFFEIVVITDAKKLFPPCALCLQTMAEFCKPDFMIHLANLDGIQESYRFTDLLTKPFGPEYLS